MKLHSLSESHRVEVHDWKAKRAAQAVAKERRLSTGQRYSDGQYESWYSFLPKIKVYFGFSLLFVLSEHNFLIDLFSPTETREEVRGINHFSQKLLMQYIYNHPPDVLHFRVSAYVFCLLCCHSHLIVCLCDDDISDRKSPTVSEDR